jgi:nicotinic acid phosphoribosyltransferase
MTGDEALLKRVLFPTDFSAYAQAVFEWIKDLRGVEEVVVLNVVDRRMHLSLGVEILTDKARVELAKLEKALVEVGTRGRSLIKHSQRALSLLKKLKVDGTKEKMSLREWKVSFVRTVGM